jgi:glutamyl-tRNA synthetase
VLIPEAELAPGVKMLRLKDLFNIGVDWSTEGRVLSYKGDLLADARAAKAPIIQWLPPGEAVPCTLVTQEGEQKGYCEPGVTGELDRVVQFERTGFARIDTVSREGIIAYFTHK